MSRPYKPCTVCTLPLEHRKIVETNSRPVAVTLMAEEGIALSQYMYNRHRYECMAADRTEPVPVEEFADAYQATADTEEPTDWFKRNGIDLPTDLDFKGATVKQNGNYLRVVPKTPVQEKWEVRVPDPVNVRIHIAARLPERTRTDLECVLLVPDEQIWYWQDAQERWHTTHDESAMDVALQIAADLEAAHGIDRVVRLGDGLDFPNVSKHRSATAHLSFLALNRSLARNARWLAELAAVSPNAVRSWIEGNHDIRVRNWLLDNAPHLIGIRPEGDPDALPVLSLENLTGATRYGWEIVGPYPEGAVWLNENTRAVHGTVVRPQPGATQGKLLTEELNQFHGHSHRAAIVYRTVVTNAGPRTYVAYSPGCLCKTVGDVPSARGGVTDTGAPGRTRAETWEQGLGVVFIDPTGRSVPNVEHIPIFSGRAVWRGREYIARCDSDGMPL